MRGFVLGVVTTMLLLGSSLNSHEPIKTIKDAESMIDAWFHTKHCEVAVLKDVDLFERKVLVKSKGIYFVMTAYGTETFEICPIAKAPRGDPKNWVPAK